MLCLPTVAKSCRTVVSGGAKNSDSGMSSKPTTATSWGVRTPASRRARNNPSAIWSLATKTAVSPRPTQPASSWPAR